MDLSPSNGPTLQVAQAFITLADTLVTGFDVIDFMHGLAEQCVRLLDVDAAGLLFAAPGEKLRLVGASSEQSRLLELFQLQTDQGPCLDCFATGQSVHCADLATTETMRRWPRFAEQARVNGFRAVDALPMRLRNQVIGAMNLFRHEPGELAAPSVALAQALADIATIGLLQERAIREGQILSEQLQHALNSRVVIEQAKGMLSERYTLPMEQSFAVLRQHARDHSRQLTELAREVVARAAHPGLSPLPPAPSAVDADPPL
ncbi:GAF and ANTAR domain-containing protein [Nonomuraea sp. NPDC049269]|uniref:GAF and ANTAR domain-containing protein n=1 Tax=Nonomuraea sp. NPDC049269 TaxID=3364349 RepID=UPI003722DF2A